MLLLLLLLLLPRCMERGAVGEPLLTAAVEKWGRGGGGRGSSSGAGGGGSGGEEGEVLSVWCRRSEALYRGRWSLAPAPAPAPPPLLAAGKEGGEEERC